MAYSALGLHSQRTVNIGACQGKGPSSITSQQRLALNQKLHTHKVSLHAVVCCAVLWFAVFACPGMLMPHCI